MHSKGLTCWRPSAGFICFAGASKRNEIVASVTSSTDAETQGGRPSPKARNVIMNLDRRIHSVKNCAARCVSLAAPATNLQQKHIRSVALETPKVTKSAAKINDSSPARVLFAFAMNHGFLPCSSRRSCNSSSLSPSACSHLQQHNLSTPSHVTCHSNCMSHVTLITRHTSQNHSSSHENNKVHA